MNHHLYSGLSSVAVFLAACGPRNDIPPRSGNPTSAVHATIAEITALVMRDAERWWFEFATCDTGLRVGMLHVTIREGGDSGAPVACKAEFPLDLATAWTYGAFTANPCARLESGKTYYMRLSGEYPGAVKFEVGSDGIPQVTRPRCRIDESQTQDVERPNRQ